jgi:hypothetical protein
MIFAKPLGPHRSVLQTSTIDLGNDEAAKRLKGAASLERQKPASLPITKIPILSAVWPSAAMIIFDVVPASVKAE